MTVPKMVSVTYQAFAVAENYLKSLLPHEACGLFAGKENEVSHFYPVRNQEPSPVSYYMDPGEQIRAFRDMREQGLDFLGIAHSHPTSEAYPSATDISLAAYPDAFYIIWSFKGLQPAARVFWLREGNIEEDKIQFRE